MRVFASASPCSSMLVTARPAHAQHKLSERHTTNKRTLAKQSLRLTLTIPA